LLVIFITLDIPKSSICELSPKSSSATCINDTESEDILPKSFPAIINLPETRFCSFVHIVKFTDFFAGAPSSKPVSSARTSECFAALRLSISITSDLKAFSISKS